MQVDLKKISSLISDQFPAFYQEEGENFIQFVKAYYEWMEEQGPIFKSRSLLEYADIDEVSDEYIDHFLAKYMYGVPKKLLMDKALLEKHILDVYRSKGSVEGLKLLFRLLYDLEVKLFVPQEDMLRASDGSWQRKQYIEIEERDINYLYNKKYITGSTSGATAFVTSSVQVYTGNQVAHLLYIIDLIPGPTGSSFVLGEYLVCDGVDINQASQIKGSASGASVTLSSENHTAGDVLEANSTSGEGIIFNVSTIKDKALTEGYITFKIKNGGYGYAVNSNINISYGTASKGAGASFLIKELSNTIIFNYNTNGIASEANTLISATSYGANLKSANASSTVNNALSFANLTIGSIKSLTAVTSGDHNYNGSLDVRVTEPRVLGYNFVDENGNLWGNNAVISGTLTAGNGIIDTVELEASGYGFNTEGEKVVFYNTSNTTLSAELTLTVGAIGKESGEWVDTSSFLNADKYIQDSDYYQEYSYEIQLEKSLDKYISVLKQIFHPVGNRVFGKPTIIDSKKLNHDILIETLTVT
jgi:hypothetical protein